MNQQPDLKEVLLDVRKAYRLVAAFQERVVSYVATIADKLGFCADEAKTWYPPGMAGTPVKNLSRDYHGWEYLPLVLAECWFLPRVSAADEGGTRPRKSSVALLVQFVPDEVFFYADDLSPSSLSPAADMRSLLCLWVLEKPNHVRIKWNELYRSPEEDHALWLDTAEYSDAWHDYDNEGISRFKEPSASHKVPGLRAYGEYWDLAYIPDEDTLLRRIEQFRATVKEKLGVDLTPNSE